MTKEEYSLHEEKVIQLLSLIRSRISSSVLDGIEHYLKHAEIEIAFELLCLGVISENIDLPQDKRTQLLVLAESLGLNSGSVYEPNFFEKLSSYVSAGSPDAGQRPR